MGTENSNFSEPGGTHCQEEWRCIPGWESYYEASNTGLIRSVPRKLLRAHPLFKNGTQNRIYGGKILSPKLSKEGYTYVNLYINNKGFMRAVHRLVCAAFTGKMEDKLDVNHINGCRSDNRAENLEWLTRRENLMHAEKVLGRKMVWAHQRERGMRRRGEL